MNYNKKFFLKVFFELIILTAIVLLCVYYIDKPLAYWIHQHHIPNQYFKWLTKIPEYLWVASPILLIASILYTSLIGKSNVFTAVFNMSLSLIIARFFVDYSKFIFGRYWPLTWVNHNPSLIKNHAYGFHFFHKGVAYQSFPSGHTAMTFAFFVALFITYPKMKYPVLAVCLLVMLGIIGMDYHFLSDVIAGSFLGSLVAVMVAKR